METDIKRSSLFADRGGSLFGGRGGAEQSTAMKGSSNRGYGRGFNASREGVEIEKSEIKGRRWGWSERGWEKSTESAAFRFFAARCVKLNWPGLTSGGALQKRGRFVNILPSTIQNTATTIVTFRE